MANIINTPIAPAHSLGQGTSTPGGHVVAYRRQPKFALDATLDIRTHSVGNKWREHSPGRLFFDKVMLQHPATVQAAIDLGAKVGISAGDVQDHLRWLYTWEIGLLVNGQLYQNAAPVAPANPFEGAPLLDPKTNIKPVKPVKVVKASVKKIAK